MKSILSITLVMLIIGSHTFAQVPEIMKYQAVARDNGGAVISNQLVSFRISILQGSSTGTTVYSETHSITTNDFGLANLNIGNGTIVSGTFSSIDWSSDLYFLQVEMDETGGTTYQLMGTSQLLSVPYALFAKTADSVTNGVHSLSDADGNTKIQVEKNPNDDIIHFDMAGTEFFKMNSGRLEVLNTGHSVFIGENAGANDNLAGNRNVAIGTAALKENINGYDLVAIGDSALYNNGFGVQFQLHGIANTAIGSKAMLSNTEGFNNTAIGFAAMRFNSTGSLNTAIGERALTHNTEGIYNTAIGAYSMGSNTTGSNNSAYGSLSLSSNTEGSDNTAIGLYALGNNMGGSENTAIGNGALYNNTQSKNTATGYAALYSNTVGVASTAIGYQSLYSNTIGVQNTASGYEALYSNIDGHWNTAMGSAALHNNTSGDMNTAVGVTALYHNTSGFENTAVGRTALFSNTDGYRNTATGKSALYYNTTGEQNTATGYQALVNNTTGHSNTAAGFQNLYHNTTGYQNTVVGNLALNTNVSGYNRTGLGYSANTLGEDYSNNTGLGYNADCTASDQVRIGNSAVGSIGGFANWSNVSDKRFKTNIEENVEGLSFIEKLRPVTYSMDLHAIDDFFIEHYDESDSSSYKGKYDKEQIRYTGFIAQEVEEAARELGYDFSGVDAPKNEDDFYGLRYAEFVVPLVKGMQEQQEIITHQTAEIEAQNKKYEKLLKRIEHLEKSNNK